MQSASKGYRVLTDLRRSLNLYQKFRLRAEDDPQTKKFLHSIEFSMFVEWLATSMSFMRMEDGWLKIILGNTEVQDTWI
jgi:hypothetical protein